MSDFNTTWHSPLNTYFHLGKLVGSLENKKDFERAPQYQKAREARIAMVLAFVVSRITDRATYIRLPSIDPPDFYLMQDKNGTMETIAVELTEYYSSTESLLDQLKRTKLQRPYDKDTVVLVHLLTEDKVDHEAIRKYAEDKKLKFKINAIKEAQQSPNTVAEFVSVYPDSFESQIDVGNEAQHFKEKYNAPPIVFAKRASPSKGSRSEKMKEEYLFAPWENLQA